MRMTINFGDGQDECLQEIAELAGVSTHEVLRAAFYHFTSTDANLRFTENPNSPEFRFLTDDEEVLLNTRGFDNFWHRAPVEVLEQVALDAAVERTLRSN